MKPWKRFALVCVMVILALPVIAQGPLDGDRRPHRGGDSFYPPPHHGEDMGGGFGGRDASEMEEMMETLMMVRLSKALDLTDEQTLTLFRRLGTYREELRGLQRERAELRRAMQQALGKKPRTEPC